MLKFIHKILLSFVCLICISLGAEIPSLGLKFNPNPIATLFAFPMQTESLEIIIENSSVTGLSLDGPLKVCFFKKEDNSLIKEIPLTKKTESSFISAPNLVGKSVFFVSSREITQLKTCIDDTLSNKNYAFVCKATDSPPATDHPSKICCTLLYAAPRAFTEGLRDILRSGVAIAKTAHDVYPEAGAFASYLIFHFTTEDLDRRIKDIFTEQSNGVYGPSYIDSIERGFQPLKMQALLQHFKEDWHFGAVFPGKISSKTQVWPTFFCYEDPDPDPENLSAFIQQLISTTLTTHITVSSPIKTEPGLIQLANNNPEISGICFGRRPLPKERAGRKAKEDSNKMILENKEAIKIARGEVASSEFGDIVAAQPQLTNINALRIRMHQAPGDKFSIAFATCIFIGSKEKVMDSKAEFDEKMKVAFPPLK